MKWAAGILLIISCFQLIAQFPPYPGIHQEQSFYYSHYDFTRESQFDSLNGIKPLSAQARYDPTNLQRIVFGYHPYWMGTAYLAYHWDLLSDLCYFSYEVDPFTGHPVTIHNWLSAPVVDSAQAYGTRVHLCVTLFESHGVFFSNPYAQQALIDTLITLVALRNASGINLDFEAVPLALGPEYNQFVTNLAEQAHDQLPGCIISIAVPAVDWNEILDLVALEPVIDLFMIMGYDYYWNGSSQAGPVDGLYSMVSGYDYNLCRTVSWYQGKGIPCDKILLGLPYYGRQWPVQQQFAPSAATGWGTALTYYTVRNNASGHYSSSNKCWEYNSFSPYFSFHSNGWNHCFINDTRSLGKRFDLVNQRHLAGFGIWALGYDHGYDDFWHLIQEKLTGLPPVIIQDTLYDSGGPAFSYYPDENYLMTVHHPDCEALHLTFLSFKLEGGMDVLSVYDGGDTSCSLLGQFTGNQVPETLTATGGAITLHFLSDVTVSEAGWMAIWHCGPMASPFSKPLSHNGNISCFPNPSSESIAIDIFLDNDQKVAIETYDGSGRLVTDPLVYTLPRGGNKIILDAGYMGISQGGLYFTRLLFADGKMQTLKWIYSGQ